MGCNCKKKLGKVQKYTDDEVFENLSSRQRVINNISKFFIGILLFIILIIVCPFIIVYAIINICLGKDVKLNLSKILKRHGKK